MKLPGPPIAEGDRLVCSRVVSLVSVGLSILTVPLSQGGLSEVPAGLPGLIAGAAAWGDYDNDADLDLVLAGFGNLTGDRLSLWRNDGGTLVERQTGLPAAALGPPAWGDYDQDGDLDLALLVGSSEPSGYATQIWNNSGLFTLAFSIPMGAFGGQNFWTDIDGDGDLDLVFSGVDSELPTVHVLRNDRGAIEHQPTGIEADVFAVADCDDDGDADIAGESGGSVRLWRHNGGRFDSVELASGMDLSSLSWADIDHDGDLDLVLCGQLRAPRPQAVTRTFRNLGGILSEAPGFLPVFALGSWAWGDFDNDGRWDLGGVTMRMGEAEAYTTVLRHSGTAFVETDLQFPFQFTSSAAFGDWDGDGDLDLLLAGGHPNGHLGTRLFRNDTLISNSPPSAPDGLAAAVTGASVTLSWQPAVDGQTPSSALTYNLRVGLAPGTAEVMSPQADLDSGRRLLPQTGNAPHGTTARLVLPAGKYYWSVQAIDTAFAGGPFSSEASFTIANPEAAAVTQETIDLLPAQAMLQGVLDPRGLSTVVWFQWGPTTAYGQNTAPQTLTGTGWRKVAQPLANLQPGVTYHYRIVANSGGGTVTGTDQSFTTPLFVPAHVLGSEAIAGSHAWADYDKDGKLDVLLTTRDPVTLACTAAFWRSHGSSFVPADADLPPLDGKFAWGDYDQDGDLDLVLAGWTSGPDAPGWVTQIWRNTGGQLVRIEAALPGSSGGPAWGDFDNDGDLDLLLTGECLPGQTIQIWQNDGTSFSQVPAIFPVLSNPQALWADCDGDDDLDLLILGGSLAGPVTQLFRNDGGVLTESVQDWGGFQGDADWADFDNDGDLDLAIGGVSRSSLGTEFSTLEIWRNDDGRFARAVLGLASLHHPELAWGDYDNDGDWDLVACGLASAGSGQCKLFRNDNGALLEVPLGLTGSGPVSWADYDADGDLDLLVGSQLWRNELPHSNSAPSPPAGLNASLNGERVLLRWNPAEDDRTASVGLSYHLRVGTQPGGEDIVAAEADLATGRRRCFRLGTQGTEASLSALELALGTYYWTVQAADSAGAGGQFAPESRFHFEEGAPLITSRRVEPSALSAHLDGMVHPRGLPTVVWLEWGKTADYGDVAICPEVAGPVGLAVQATLSGLDAETSYHYRWAARNSAGTTYSPGDVFHTGRFSRVAGLPDSVEVTAADWGDLDGDGDEDLVVCGVRSQKLVTQIWWNDQWIFRPGLAQLPGIVSGTVVVGDYDQDGDVDFLVASTSTAQVWGNRAGVFSLAASLPGVMEGNVGWGDFDNDGDLDVLLCGWDGAGDIIQVWRNDAGAFLPSGVGLPARAWPHGSWADYDQDGDLDLLLAAADASPASSWLSSAAEVWSNEHGQFFNSTTLDLLALGAAGEWADYDSDGLLDIALTSPGAPAQIRHNHADSLTDANAGLPSWENASAAWGDFDGDGDLDLALAGLGASGRAHQVWRNDAGKFTLIEAGFNTGAPVAWSDFDRDGDLDLLTGAQLWRNEGASANAPPAMPAALNHSASGNRVTFAWNAASDDHTPSPGLSYRLRVETASLPPGATPLSLTTVQRSTRTHLDLPDGIYYWTVQTLDSAEVGSSWAPETRIVLSPDADADGLPDVWELCHALNPSASADATVDSDGDGISNVDEFIANTDARDPASLLTILAVEADGPDLVVSFSSARGKAYHLESSDTSPDSLWTRVKENIPGDGGVVGVHVPGGNERRRTFYRVVARP